MAAVDSLISELKTHLSKIKTGKPEDIKRRVGYAKVAIQTAIKDGIPLTQAMPWINKIKEIERSHDDR